MTILVLLWLLSGDRAVSTNVPQSNVARSLFVEEDPRSTCPSPAQILVRHKVLKPNYLMEAWLERVNPDGSVRLSRMDIETRSYVHFTFDRIRFAANANQRAAAVAYLERNLDSHQGLVRILSVSGNRVRGDLNFPLKNQQLPEFELVREGLAIPIGKRDAKAMAGLLKQAKARHAGMWATGH